MDTAAPLPPPNSSILSPRPRRKRAGKRKNSHPPFSLTTSEPIPCRNEIPRPPSPSFDHPSWTSNSRPSSAPPRHLGPQLSRWARSNLSNSSLWTISEASTDVPIPEAEVEDIVGKVAENAEEGNDGGAEDGKDELTGMMDYDAEDPEDNEFKARMGMRF